MHITPSSKINIIQKWTFTTKEHEHNSKINIYSTSSCSKTVWLSSAQHKRMKNVW